MAKQVISPKDSCLHLYHAAALSDSPGSDAIASTDVDWASLPQDDKTEQAHAILKLLLGDCQNEDFVSPLPQGTALQDLKIQGYTAYVDFSSAYGQLSGIDLTIADYCVALSLTQISGIHAVYITVNGQELSYQDTNRFLASDVLLTSTEDVVRSLSVQLYFPDEGGSLMPEERLLTVYEGESRLSVVIDALMAGPEGDHLSALLPEGFSALSVWQENGVCYLNLPRDDEQLMPGDHAAQKLLLAGLVNSLCSVEDVTSVQVLVDGESVSLFGTLDVSAPIAPTA